MPRLSPLIFALFLGALLLAGCQREEPPPVTAPAKKPTLQVMVPPEVKTRWKAVKIVVHDKQAARDQVFTVDIGAQFVLVESGLQVTVANFLPAFVTDGRIATTAGNDPKNPGVEIVVQEGGKETFHGWLLRNAPDDHGFKHPRYTLTLQDIIPRR
jgi:hypothetical protein